MIRRSRTSIHGLVGEKVPGRQAAAKAEPARGQPSGHNPRSPHRPPLPGRRGKQVVRPLHAGNTVGIKAKQEILQLFPHVGQRALASSFRFPQRGHRTRLPCGRENT